MKKIYAISFSILFLIIIGLLFYQSKDLTSLGFQSLSTQNEVNLKETQSQALKVSEAKSAIQNPKVNINSAVKQHTTVKPTKIETFKDSKQHKNTYVFDRES